MIGHILPQNHVHIYGAGFAGLSLAYRLKNLGIPFSLYEKQNIGGKISTNLSSYGPIERAASTLYMNVYAEKFVKDLNLPYLCAEKKLKRWLWLDGKIQSPLNFNVVKKIFINGWRRTPEITRDMTVEDFFLPLLEKKLIDELLSSALQGIYAAKAQELHLLSLYPFMEGKNYSNYFTFIKDLKQQMSAKAPQEIKGSISFSGGMQSLVNRLYEEVKESILPLPQSLILPPNTVICTDARDAADLVERERPEIAAELRKITYRPLSTLTFFSGQELSPLKKSFGMLIPQNYEGHILGIIHQSAIFPQNYKAHCYSVICKGVQCEQDIFSELKDKIPQLEEFKILDQSLTNWERGLPLYDKNRYESIKKIKELLQPTPGLAFFGNYTEGISLRSMIEQTQLINVGE